MALLVLGVTTAAYGDNQWLGGSGTPTDIWSDGANWDSGMVPQSATDRHVDAMAADDLNVARFLIDGTNTLIDSSVNAVAFAVQLGAPGLGFGNQAASNTLNMTGGTLTTQGNFLFNVGRGTNVDPMQLAQFNMSGGLVNAAGITIPEAFGPSVGSVGVNAEMHVSGSSIVNTDLLRLGSNDSNGTLTISDDAQVNLNDDNNGFANGQLWLESFEFMNNDPGIATGNPDLSMVTGNSLLDISGNGVMNIYGGVNGLNISDDPAANLEIITNVLIPQGWITANGGVGPNNVVGASLSLTEGTPFITLQAIPEPSSLGMLVLVLPFMLRLRRNR